MAEATRNIDRRNTTNIILDTIERLENEAESVKSEINARVDSLIETVIRQRQHFLNKIDNELAKAKEPLQKFENEMYANFENTKKRVGEDLKGNDALISRITNYIDDELQQMLVGLPKFEIQWNPSFTRISKTIEEIGQLKIYTQTRFESISNPIWTSLNNGKADHEVVEAKAIAIDTETSKIYVGDGYAGKILVFNGIGDYLNTLKLKNPPSIGEMAILQHYIYCRSNIYTPMALYRIDSNSGEILNQFGKLGTISAFTTSSDKIFLCESRLLLYTLPLDLSNCVEMRLQCPYLKKGLFDFSVVKSISFIKEELVLLIHNSIDFPIQIFDQKAVLLRTIAEDIPGIGTYEARMCINKHLDILIASCGNNLVSVYSKEGKKIGSVGRAGQGRDELYQPKCIAMDRNGNLIVCNNRKNYILQAY